MADSAPATVSLDEIEQRDGDRGLGIVRDLVRRWGGHLVVRREPPPFVKAIGAAFPVARDTNGESIQASGATDNRGMSAIKQLKRRSRVLRIALPPRHD